MQYIKDQKSGNELSRLGFGCMRFPRDKAKTKQLIEKAINAGINYFDTAYVYPGSEATLGEILHSLDRREQIYLATKLPHLKCRKTEDFDNYFSQQTERLQTEYFDYYLIHNIADLASWQRLTDLGITEWVEQKKAAGLIKQFGFSFHGSLDGFLELLTAYPWDFCQIQYNYLDENYQAGRAGLQAASDQGLAVMVMEPLLGGRLAKGLPAKAERLFHQADPDLSQAAWGFRWLYDQPEVTVVLSGMNSMEQLEDNLNTAATAQPGMLSTKEKAVYQPVIKAIKAGYKVACTGCNYCMPCPHGVNIPGCFAAYNSSYTLGLFTGFQQYVTGTSANRPDNNSRVTHCVACQACEAKCPQHIAIAAELVKVKKRLEPFWFRGILKIIQKMFS